MEWTGCSLDLSTTTKTNTQQQQLHEQNGSQGTQFGFISTSKVKSERLSFKLLVLVHWEKKNQKKTLYSPLESFIAHVPVVTSMFLSRYNRRPSICDTVFNNHSSTRFRKMIIKVLNGVDEKLIIYIQYNISFFTGNIYLSACHRTINKHQRAIIKQMC